MIHRTGGVPGFRIMPLTAAAQPEQPATGLHRRTPNPVDAIINNLYRQRLVPAVFCDQTLGGVRVAPSPDEAGCLEEAECHYQMGLAVARADGPEALVESAQHYAAAVLHDPSFATAYVLLIRSLIDSGNALLAWNYVRLMSEHCPEDFRLANVISSVAEALWEYGCLSTAYQAYGLALAYEKNDANLWCDFGIVCAQLSGYSEAEEAYEKALALNPYHVWSLYNLCSLYLRYRLTHTEKFADAFNQLEELDRGLADEIFDFLAVSS